MRQINYIFVEGNIGAGKSTLLRHIADRLAVLLPPPPRNRIVVVAEPVDRWTDPEANVLAALYADPVRNAMLFQTHALVTRVEAVDAAIDAAAALSDEQTCVWAVCERSIYSDAHIFVRACPLSDLERAVYYQWFQAWSPRLYSGNIVATVYLQCQPETCLRRIDERSRAEEKNGVPLVYLRELHALHERQFVRKALGWNQSPCLLISTETDSVAQSAHKAARAIVATTDNGTDGVH